MWHCLRTSGSSAMFYLYFLPILYHAHLTSAAFSLPSSCADGYVQQNHNHTWCYYPVAGATRAVSCGGDYTFILGVHLNQTTSIGYYQPDGTRWGGAEWVVPPTNPGQIYLCASGRAGDGTYQTFCATPITADNSIPQYPSCVVANAQSVVTDRCYDPGQLPYPTDSSLISTGTWTRGSPPTVTVSVYSAGPRTFLAFLFC